MIRRINGTDLLVECSTSLQSETLLKTTKMFEGEVHITPHESLNNSKGFIISNESFRCTDDELNEWLKDFDVVSVFRFPLRTCNSDN